MGWLFFGGVGQIRFEWLFWEVDFHILGQGDILTSKYRDLLG